MTFLKVVASVKGINKMRLSHKNKIIAKRKGRLFKSYEMLTDNDLSEHKSSGKNTKHTLFVGTTRKGKPFRVPFFNEQSPNFEEVVNNLPLNNTGKSRLVDSFINPNKP